LRSTVVLYGTQPARTQSNANNYQPVRGHSMTDRDPFKGSLGQLKFALSNLIDRANTSPKAATIINLACAGLGALVWHTFSGVVAFAGAVFAIVSLWGIVKWVLFEW